MAIDYAEKEREFLENLAQDTGRDLAGWMAAIAGTGLHDRNAIIDWLRQQGFLFARASWLERIHNNGGRPIYLDAATFANGPAAREKPAVPNAASPRLSIQPPPAAAPLPVERAVVQLAPAHVAPPQAPREKWSGSLDVSLETVLAEAKGYRPLAQLILREIETAAPGVRFGPREGYIAILAGSGNLAGVLTITAKELRLALVLGTRGVLPPFVKPKFAKSTPDIPGAFTHMIILSDARQVTPELTAAVADAVASA